MKWNAEVLQSEQIKQYFKYYVFCKINADHQPNVLQAYGVSGLPTHIVADATGAVIEKSVGYGGPAAFYAFLDRNK